MKTSTEYSNVFRAMALARTEMPPITMDANNPYFKSKYSSLGEILKTIQPTLDKYKLSIVSTLEGDGVNYVGITTRVTHYESGEWVESTAYIPLKGGSDKTQLAQVAGIDFSYLRRYSINAMFNLISEEDVDGNIYGYEKPPKTISRHPVKADKPKAKRNEPAEEKVADKSDEYEEEFTHLFNKAVALGNAKEDLPKPKKDMTEKDWIEALAEITIIVKESEEGE